jgi:hypothetical protein
MHALREVARAHLVYGSETPSDDALRVSAQLMCEHARASGARVEELLICLKRVWPSIAGGERIPRLESSRLLARFVTLCVREYYAPSG